MEAKLNLKDGFSGTAKTLAGGKLRLTIDAPDTEINRAFLLDCLFSVQSQRFTFNHVPAPTWAEGRDRRGKNFPLVCVERPRAAANQGEIGGYACFTIKGNRYDEGPIFFTLGATHEDLENALRAELCLNRHSSISNADIMNMPHAADSELAFQILSRTVAEVLAGSASLEDLQAGYDEARRYGVIPAEEKTPPPIRFTAPLPDPETACHYCGGKGSDKYNACPFKGYRPGECFKLTGITPDGKTPDPERNIVSSDPPFPPLPEGTPEPPPNPDDNYQPPEDPDPGPSGNGGSGPRPPKPKNPLDLIRI